MRRFWSAACKLKLDRSPYFLSASSQKRRKACWASWTVREPVFGVGLEVSVCAVVISQTELQNVNHLRHKAREKEAGFVPGPAKKAQRKSRMWGNETRKGRGRRME